MIKYKYQGPKGAPWSITGLTSDVKPTAGIPPWSNFEYLDTGEKWIFDGATWYLIIERTSVVGSLPNQTNLNTALPTNATLIGISDGTNIQAQTGNIEGTLLASSARTANASSPDQTNNNAKGVTIALNITAASGIGGLQVQLQVKDPVSGGYVNLNTSPASIVATGLYLFLLYPGIITTNASSIVKQGVGVQLPRTWRLLMVVQDGSSYTYSVGYSLNI